MRGAQWILHILAPRREFSFGFVIGHSIDDLIIIFIMVGTVLVNGRLNILLGENAPRFSFGYAIYGAKEKLHIGGCHS